jgi:signal transduction histidine kinase
MTVGVHRGGGRPIRSLSRALMAVHPITLERLSAEARAARGPLDAALVGELIARTKVAGLPLIGAVALMWLLAGRHAARGGGWLYAAVIALAIARTGFVTWVERQAGRVPYMRAFAGIAACYAVIGVALAAIVIVSFATVPPLNLAMCAVCTLGIDYSALVTLAASPLVLLLYAPTNLASVLVMSLVTPVAGLEWEFPVIATVFAASLLALAPSVHRSLRKNLEIRLELGDSLAALRDAQAQLIAASRLAGRADVASAVIHNVGNVLNSVNVSAQLVVTAIAGWKTAGLGRAAALLAEHAGDLGGFLRGDPRGPTLVSYLAELAQAGERDKRAVTGELQALIRNIEHIRAIVRSQAAQVRVAEVAEACEVGALIDDAVRFSVAPDAGLDVVCAVEAVAPVTVDRHKALQIVMNLLTNARDAVAANPPGARQIVVSARRVDAALEIVVEDNGGGIAAEDVARIFALGFTTKPHGQGLGLHYSACAARELGGSLTVRSAGVGHGAAFCLALPVAPPRRATGTLPTR